MGHKEVNVECKAEKTNRRIRGMRFSQR